MNSGKADAPAADEFVHLVTIDWTRGKWSGTRGKYSREHQWHFAGRLSLKVSDALSPAAYRDTAVRQALGPISGNKAFFSEEIDIGFLGQRDYIRLETLRYGPRLRG